MNTFLPSTSFEQSAKWLDTLRLGKQRVECLQILKALTDPSYGWQNHPAVKMWRGYTPALVDYGLTICGEWIERGYKDRCYNKIRYYFNEYSTVTNPPWLTESFASNHRSILLGKAHENFANKIIDYQIAEDNKSLLKLNKVQKVIDWYQSHGWTEQPASRNDDGKWPYLWPTDTTKKLEPVYFYCKIKKWHIIDKYKWDGKWPKSALCGVAIGIGDTEVREDKPQEQVCIRCQNAETHHPLPPLLPHSTSQSLSGDT